MSSQSEIPALSAREIRAILAGPLVAMFIAALDQTIVAPALPTIADDLKAFTALSWVITAYLLASTAATPIFGKLSDLYGRRNLLLLAIVIFMLGSVLCAVAQNMLWLVLARALQGIGGGGLLALPNTVIADVVSPRDRGKYQGYFAAIYTVSGIAGPLLGGVLTETWSWTLIFWINVPLGLIACWVSYRALSHVHGPKRQHSIDYPGAFLMVMATLSFLLALTTGGHRYDWNSREIALLLTAAVIFTGFFALSQRRAREPILPLSILGNPIVRLTSFIGFIIVMVNASVSVYVPLWLEMTRAMSPANSGLVLIAPMITVVVGAVISGQYMRATGRYKLPPVIGFWVSALALCALALWGNSMALVPAMLLLGLFGLGLGTGFPAVMVATQNAVDVKDIGTATGSQAFFRSLGGAVGGALFRAIILSGLHGRGDVAEVLRQNLGADGVAHGFSLMFAAAAIASAAGALGLMRLTEIPLRQHAAKAAPKP